MTFQKIYVQTGPGAYESFSAIVAASIHPIAPANEGGQLWVVYPITPDCRRKIAAIPGATVLPGHHDPEPLAAEHRAHVERALSKPLKEGATMRHALLAVNTKHGNPHAHPDT
jgi:hypothetical protein